MIFHQVVYHDLGCASYLLADGGEAIVVDPCFDVEVYLRIAEDEGVQIMHVLDTHMHADHVSGRELLAARAGAQSHRPAEEARDAGASGVLAPGDELRVGSLRLLAAATPGHRPEHLSFVVSDLSRSEEPWLVLSGDSLLVGDLARPDLAVEARAGARDLHTSLSRLLSLGDQVEVWPAHIGGSLCGGAGLSGKTSSTIGYERRHNPLLASDQTHEGFVEELLRELPARPPTVERVVGLNRLRSAGAPAALLELDADGLSRQLAAGARVVDGRSPDAFDEAHLLGAINLPPGRAQGTRAGWVLTAEHLLVVVAADLTEARRLAGALHAVGLWNIAGVIAADPQGWRETGLDLRTGASWDVSTLAERLKAGKIAVVDVREHDEWADGHVPNSHNLPLHQLADRVPQLPAATTLAVVCAAGARAAFAASVIRSRGLDNVIRVAGGGIGELPSHGVPLTVGD